MFLIFASLRLCVKLLLLSYAKEGGLAPQVKLACRDYGGGDEDLIGERVGGEDFKLLTHLNHYDIAVLCG